MVKSVSGFHGVFFSLVRMFSAAFGGGRGPQPKQGGSEVKQDKQDTFVYSMY